MWLFSPKTGFFSIVQKPGVTRLTVRARVAADLDRLRKSYLPSLTATVGNAGSDYAFRATASSEAVSKAAAQMVAEIDYPNFKNEVARRGGKQRAAIYSRVWVELLALQGARRSRNPSSWTT